MSSASTRPQKDRELHVLLHHCQCGRNGCVLHTANVSSCSLTQARRHRRGSDWDQYNPDYDIVASYSSRVKDVQDYPQHKAYIWGKRFGVSKVYAHFGAGGFIGAASNGQKYKVRIKVNVQKVSNSQ